MSLGQFAGKEAMAAFAQIAEKNMEEPLFRLAVLSSLPGSSPEFTEMLGRRNVFKNSTPGKLKYVEDLGYIAGARNGKNEMGKLLSAMENADKDMRATALVGLAKGIKRSPNKSAPDKSVSKTLQKWSSDAPENVKKAAESVRKALDI